jgi:SAM-dependent methyltransferase
MTRATLPVVVASPSRSRPAISSPLGTGLKRSVELFRAFRVEQSDPDHFYSLQAADTVAQAAGYMELAGAVVLDVGGGAGYFTEAFRQAGALCFLVEPEAGAPAENAREASDELGENAASGHRSGKGRLVPGAAVAADGNCMPFPDGIADLCFSSNVLEHVADSRRFIEESVRVTKPGGLVYLSFTAWLSPWGGHETAPWHYLGGRRAAMRYSRRTGHPPSNLYGESLFARYVGPTLQLVHQLPDADVVDVLPRYYPDWMRWVVHVPGLRELATWNLLVILRRHDRH